jgi:hypothetical protein
MIQVHQVAIGAPLTVGTGAVLCTIFIHALALGATVNFFRRETRLGRAGMRYLIDLTIVVLVMSFAFVAHMVEVAIWAVLFMICGEFQDFGAAYYHSAVNYSTLGYGDLIMSPSWKIARTTRGGRWITDVRGIDRDGFCGYSAFNSDSVCGSQRLSGDQLLPKLCLLSRMDWQ